MSDYLWDKTGEPDAETERLENLLGQLRFQPTPFDVPAELPVQQPRLARARRSAFTWPRLALAASLTLALLAGAWVMLRQQAGTTDDGAQQVVRQNDQPDSKSRPSVPDAPVPTAPATENGAGVERKGSETPALDPSPVRPRREERAAARPRPRLPDLAKRRVKSIAPRVEPARREEAAQLAAEREAAEKVLYALRVTSEKLNYARQQVQATSRSEDNR